MSKPIVCHSWRICLLSKSEFCRSELLLCINSVFSTRANFTDVSFLRRNIFPTSQIPFQTSHTPFPISQTSIHQHPKHQFLYLATFPTSQGPFPTSQTRPNGIINTPCIDFYTSWHFQHPMHRFLYIVAEVKPRQEDSHASTNNFYEYKISIVER